jgi:hypothetical protein
MAITYPLAAPAVARSRLSIRKIAAVGESVSPFTFEQQVYVHQGVRLEADIEFPLAVNADHALVRSFLFALNGKEGTFTMGPENSKTPRGVMTGSPVVNGAGQTGRTLSTRGWTNSITGIVKAGDWIQLGSGATAHLYQVVQDASSNGSGIASLELGRPLLSSPADGATITVSNPVGVWRLTSNAVDWSEELANLYGAIKFSAREAF